MDLIELKESETGENKHPWESARLSFVLRRLQEIRAKQSSRCPTAGFNILDVGCGDAFVASELAARFRDGKIVGYDPFFEPEVLELLRNRYKLLYNLKLTKNLSGHFSDQPVSVITLLDVIEHVPDDIALLKELRQHPQVSVDTHFLITVPAYQQLFSSHDVFMKHFRRYDRKMLHSHLADAGFEVIESRYFFFSLLLPRWWQVKREGKQSNRDMDGKTAGGVARWSHAKIFTQLVNNALLLDWKLTDFIHRLGFRLPGLSLYCLCRPVA